MKEIRKKAWAGTMESSDAYVEVKPAETLAVELQSVVQAQFGPAIEAAVADVAAQCGVTKGHVKVMDRGALECVIRARVETALLRGMEG